jgi:hypothetical protein
LAVKKVSHFSGFVFIRKNGRGAKLETDNGWSVETFPGQETILQNVTPKETFIQSRSARYLVT